jgi:hypothetical protein
MGMTVENEIGEISDDRMLTVSSVDYVSIC